MSAPTRRLGLVLATLLPLALLPALVAARYWPLWALALALVLVAAGVDTLVLPRSSALALELHVPPTLFVGQTGACRVHIEARGWPVPIDVELLLDIAAPLAPTSSRHGRLSARQPLEIELPLPAPRRGRGGVSAVHLRLLAPLGLVQRLEKRAVAATVDIVPDLRPVRQAALRFFTARQFVAGLKIERYVGEGSEFDSLKDYVPGLDLRALDWKASARRRRLLAREYRAERNHEVVLAIDGGWLMSAPVQGLARLDHAIHAALLLAYVALRSGDRVGLHAFDERPRLFLAPQRGPLTFRHLQRASARLTYTQAETNFTLALLDLARRLQRRSLVVVLTDFADSVTAELMIDNLGRLARRHLVLFVALADTLPAELARRAPQSLADVGRAVVGRDLQREREGVLRRLVRQGVHCLDLPPAAVSTRLVNRYLDLRRRELV
jgi:uncharacterized protein (DUF58 family)